MHRFRVRFTVPVEVVVTVEAETDDQAEDIALARAQDRLNESTVSRDEVALFGSLDDVDSVSVEPVA